MAYSRIREVLRTGKLLILGLVISFSAGGLDNKYNFITQDEFKCLVDNVYYEARGESKEGMRLVAKTTINRSRDSRFPGNVCAVVYEPAQFSWTLKPKAKIDKEEWQRVAKEALHGIYHPSNALWFHSKKVKPAWRKRFKIVAIEGNHIFYR